MRSINAGRFTQAATTGGSAATGGAGLVQTVAAPELLPPVTSSEPRATASLTATPVEVASTGIAAMVQVPPSSEVQVAGPEADVPAASRRALLGSEVVRLPALGPLHEEPQDEQHREDFHDGAPSIVP